MTPFESSQFLCFGNSLCTWYRRLLSAFFNKHSIYALLINKYKQEGKGWHPRIQDFVLGGGGVRSGLVPSDQFDTMDGKMLHSDAV